MDEIPSPQVLDPDRVSRDDRADMTTEDHRSQAQLLATALSESCDYARQLWDDLAAVRRYLHDSLPPETGTTGVSGGVSPHGPDDETGWQRWIDAYAAVTSVLCGPKGDNGYGRGSAQQLARSRREIVVPVVDRDPSEDDPPVLPPTDTPAEDHRAVAQHARLQPEVQDELGHQSEPATPRTRPFPEPLLYGLAGSLATVLVLSGRLRRHRGE